MDTAWLLEKYNSTQIVDEVAYEKMIDVIIEEIGEKEPSVAEIDLVISLLDLTSLEATDSIDDARALVARGSLTNSGNPRVGGICVFGDLVGVVKNELTKMNSSSKSVAVAGGFPHGRVTLEVKLSEIKEALDLGADEIDMVINRVDANNKDYDKIYQEIRAIKNLCLSFGEEKKLKVILETGELVNLNIIKDVSHIALEAGADFLKTSTGKVTKVATFYSVGVMLEAVGEFYQLTKQRRGVKISGGVRNASTAVAYLRLAEKMLNKDWLDVEHLRFGASGLLEVLLDDRANNISGHGSSNGSSESTY